MADSTFIKAHDIRKIPNEVTEQQPVSIAVRNHQLDENHDSFDMHHCLELGLVLSGKMNRYYQDNACCCATNSLWLCDIWQPHGYQLIDEDCSVLVLMVSPTVLQKQYFPESDIHDWQALFSTYCAQELHFSIDDSAFINLKERLLSLAATADSPFRQFYLHLAILELLALIHQRFKQNIAPATDAKKENRVQAALNLVYQKDGLITVQQAALACGLSEDVFRRSFKHYMNTSFTQFTIRYRIQQAAQLLTTTDQPIKLIADKLGFTDSSHFHRLFVRFYQQTPKSFRKKIELNNQT